MKKLLFLLFFLPLITANAQDAPIYLEGVYNDLTFQPNKIYLVLRHAVITNININSPGKLIVSQNAQLHIGSNMRLSGDFHVTVRGLLFVQGDIDIQNGNNIIEVLGGRVIANIGKINDDSSKITICDGGHVLFKDVFSLNKGSENVISCSCKDVFEVYGLDIGEDVYKPFKGEGFIKITSNHFNLNNYFGSGYLYYSEHISLIKYLENVIRVNVDFICGSLPILYSTFKISDGVLTFKVEQAEEIQNIIVETSLNGKDWIPVKGFSNIKNQIYSWFTLDYFQ